MPAKAPTPTSCCHCSVDSIDPPLLVWLTGLLHVGTPTAVEVPLRDLGHLEASVGPGQAGEDRPGTERDPFLLEQGVAARRRHEQKLADPKRATRDRRPPAPGSQQPTPVHPARLLFDLTRALFDDALLVLEHERTPLERLLGLCDLTFAPGDRVGTLVELGRVDDEIGEPDPHAS